MDLQISIASADGNEVLPVRDDEVAVRLAFLRSTGANFFLAHQATSSKVVMSSVSCLI